MTALERLIGTQISVTTGKMPPSAAFISDPIIETPGVRYYDPLKAETVDVSEISGVNPLLGSQLGENRRISVNVRPVRKLPLQLFAEGFVDQLRTRCRWVDARGVNWRGLTANVRISSNRSRNDPATSSACWQLVRYGLDAHRPRAMDRRPAFQRISDVCRGLPASGLGP